MDVFLFVAELNEIKATTLAPPWLPKGAKGPDKGKKELPQFDSNLVTNVTVQLGENAFLRCKVRNLGEHKASPTIITSIFITMRAEQVQPGRKSAPVD